MQKKTLIQFFLLLILFAIVIFTFFFYFYKKENIKETNFQSNKNIETQINIETGTLINDINYTFSDSRGNNYQLFAEFGKVDINEPGKIFMTNVIATIYLTNTSPVKITSKFANYNKIDHETNFFNNVRLTYLNHEATSQNLDLSFINNLASMYNNIIYKKPGTILTADRLSIDLITKNSKIFMDNKYEKIKIINKN